MCAVFLPALPAPVCACMHTSLPANPISSDCVYAFYYIYLQPLLIQLVRKTVRCFLFHLRFTQLLTPVRVYAPSFLAFVALCLQFSSSITLKRHQWSLGSGRAGKGGRICHGCFTLASLSRVPGLAVPRARRFMIPKLLTNQGLTSGAGWAERYRVIITRAKGIGDYVRN